MIKIIFAALAICFSIAVLSATQQTTIRSEALRADSFAPPLSGTRTTDGDPIDLFTGLYIRTSVDLLVPDTIPIKLERTYRNADRKSRAFGIGASHPYDMFIVGDAVAFTYVELILADGGRIHYDRISAGKSYSDGVFEHTSTPTEFYKSRISWNGTGWTVALKDGSSYKILGCSPGTTRPGQCGVIEHRDSHGNTLKIERQPNGNVTRIISPNNKWIAFTYDNGDRVIRADSSLGKSVNYRYDDKGRLVTLELPPTKTNAEGRKLRYEYDGEDRMTAAFEPGVQVHNFYDHDLCVRQMASAHGYSGSFKFNYIFNTQKKHIQTDVSEPDGTLRRVTFDSDGYPLSDIRRAGRPDEASLIYQLNPHSKSIMGLTISCASTGAKFHFPGPISSPQAGEFGDDNTFLSVCEPPGMAQ